MLKMVPEPVPPPMVIPKSFDPERVRGPTGLAPSLATEPNVCRKLGVCAWAVASVTATKAKWRRPVLTSSLVVGVMIERCAAPRSGSRHGTL